MTKGKTLHKFSSSFSFRHGLCIRIIILWVTVQPTHIGFCYEQYISYRHNRVVRLPSFIVIDLRNSFHVSQLAKHTPLYLHALLFNHIAKKILYSPRISISYLCINACAYGDWISANVQWQISNELKSNLPNKHNLFKVNTTNSQCLLRVIYSSRQWNCWPKVIFCVSTS